MQIDHCLNCNAALQVSDKFCPACGRPASPGQAEVGYTLSPRRIVVMSILSWGLYLFYWFYLSWRQYRDHTGREVFPIWHALAIAVVPIYGLFRAHAHVSAWKRLMEARGLATTVSAGWVVFWVIVVSYLGTAFTLFPTGEVSLTGAVALLILDVISAGIVIALLLALQGDLSKYWDNVASERQLFSTAPRAPVRLGEVVLAILGLLAWSDTISMVFSESYRTGF